MSDTHSHDTSEKDLRFGLILNTGFTLIEFVAGILSGSLALISDATHNLTDSLSILVSLAGERVSKRKADKRHTYGHGRAAVLAALINASILLGLSVFIFSEAYQRLRDPQPVEGGVVAVVAAIGIAVNITVAWRFAKDRSNINIRSAFLNMALDALASLGAVIAGVLMVVTGETYFDPLISLVIATMLLISGASIIRQAAHILLEGVPDGINAEDVEAAIVASNGVRAIDDLHIWALSAHSTALSCHVTVEANSLEESIAIVRGIKQKLQDDYQIDHATIETELVPC